MTGTAEYKRPVYRITVDGENITANLNGRLMSLQLTDNKGFETDQLDITLDDHDGLLDLPPRGAVVDIAFGWQETGLVEKGSFTVDEVSHSGTPDMLTIRARSADLRSGLTTQRERAWHEITVGDIIKTIAGENDLIPIIASALAGQTIAHMDQTNESSANFITRLAEQFDAIATVKSGRLLFVHAGAGKSASGKAIKRVVIDRQVGDQHTFNIADRETYTHVKATYHDTAGATKGEVVWGKAEDAAENNRPLQAAAVPAGKYKTIAKVSKSRSAAKRLARKEWKRISQSAQLRAGYVGVKTPYNDRNLDVVGEVAYGIEDQQRERRSAARLAAQDAAKSGEPSVAIDHSADNMKVLRHVYASRESARRAARTEWRRIQRGMAEFSITLAHGQPEIIPEMPATVQGFKPAIDNTDWIVSKVKHDLNDSGFTTRLDFEIKATEIPG